MKRYKILHRTYYNFTGEVTLDPHELRLRPREGHELRIESSSLKLSPDAKLRWRRDVEDNSVATAEFTKTGSHLSIESEVIIQQFNEIPLDFVVAPYAVNYPFAYLPEDLVVLAPYIEEVDSEDDDALSQWIDEIWKTGESIQTYTLLKRISEKINTSLTYKIREEEGVQSAGETLESNSGSCRDFAALFMSAARRLGLAARFVSGYLNTIGPSNIPGSTHAWAEIYIPGAGWKGFDPTVGVLVGPNHFAVAVARLPESVPPIAGAFTGPPGSQLSVGVWVSQLP